MDTDKITETVISCAIKVSNTLGSGFLEKIYENALNLELGKTNLKYEAQKKIHVKYENTFVGEYVADLVIENRVIVEIKAVRALDDIHQAQLLNYLRATGIKIGLILNFGTPRLGIKRMVL